MMGKLMLANNSIRLVHDYITPNRSFKYVWQNETKNV